VGSRVAGHHLAGVHARTQRDRDVPVALELRRQLPKRIPRLCRRAHSAQRVVLVDGRQAEDPDQAAARRRLGARAVPLEHSGHGLGRKRHRAAEGFRVVRSAEAEHVGHDHGDCLSRRRPRDLFPRGLRDTLLGRELEGRVVSEHSALEPLQRPARLEPELLDENLARLVVNAKSLGLTA
jgi:hypothetical protein